MPSPESAAPEPRSYPPSDWVIRNGLNIGLGVIAIVAGGILLWYTAQVLLVFFAAIFLAVFFGGLGRYMSDNSRFSYTTCVAFALIGLLQIIILAGLIVGPAIVSGSATLSDQLPKSYHELMGKISKSEIGSRVLASAENAMSESKDSSWSSSLKFAGLTLHGLGGLVFALVIAVFLAFQPDLYRTGFLNLFPKKRRARLGAVLDELGFTLWWWLMGQLVTMASVGLLIGLGLALLGVPLAGTLGLIAAILSFIPSLGPLMSVIPALLLGFTISPKMGLWVCLLYAGVQVLEANVITPLVQRRAISLPPAFVLGSELLMGLLLGGAGLAFATPLCAVLLVLVNMLYIQDILKDKGSLPSQQRKQLGG